MIHDNQITHEKNRNQNISTQAFTSVEFRCARKTKKAKAAAIESIPRAMNFALVASLGPLSNM